jgi:transcriptional regulator with XRE-family HTH domain
MKNEKVVRYLSELAASARPRQLTDEEIDALLASEPEGSSEKDERAWPKFVKTVLSNLHPEPVRSKGKNTTLGDFLKEAMDVTNFTREDVAAAVGKDASFIEQILRSNPPLSIIDPDDTADVASLLRIHICALEEMLSKQLPPQRSGGTAEIREGDAKWLEAVRRALQRRDQYDLID